MALDFTSELPPDSGIEYWKLPATDKRIINRIPFWISDEVIFCREACNFYPHWYQESLLRDRSLFVAAAWSRQIGKSESVAHKAVYHAFTHKDEAIVIIAPGQRQARELYRKVVLVIEKSPLIYNSVIGKIKMEETLFSSGCRIINLPSGDEGTALRGYTIALLIVDEAAFVPDAVFVAVEQGLSSSGGQQINISTPQGKHNEFYRMFFPEGQGEHFPIDDQGDMVNGHHEVGDYSLHHYDYEVGLAVKRPDGSIQLSKPHLDRQQRRLTEWQWRSEYKAQFVEDIDSFFRRQLIERMFNNRFSRAYARDPRAIYFGGIDIAKTRDFTVFTTGRLLTVNPHNGAKLMDPHLQIVDMSYWKGTAGATIEALYPHFVALVKKWGHQFIWFDQGAIGERPYEELRHHYKLPIEGIHFSQANKVQMYGTLNYLMSSPGEIPGWDARIQSYQDGEAVKQFSNLIYELGEVKTRTGGKRKADNVKIYASHGHDDIPASFALLSNCISNPIISAPVAGMVKPDVRARDMKVMSNIYTGIPRSNKSAVTGFGKKRTGRKSRKVFWQ